MSELLLFSRCLIGVVFAVAAWSKLRGFPGFEASLRQLDVVPVTSTRPVAVAVVASELAVTLAMVVWPLPGFVGAIVLLGGFTSVVVLTMRRGMAANCRCFGASGARFGRRHILRNIALAAAAVTGAVLVAAGAGDATDAALAVGSPVALLCALALIRLDDLVFLFAPAAGHVVRQGEGRGVSTRPPT